MGNKRYLCATPEEIKEFMEKTGVKFCLDINHAIETAVYLNKNYLEFGVTDGATPFNCFSDLESTDYSASGYYPLDGYYNLVNYDINKN